MKERQFAYEIGESMRELGFYYKISDIPKAMGLRFQHERPLDAFLLQDGMFKAIEYKVLKHKTIKLSRDLKQHQIKNLNEVVKNGGEAYIIFYIEKNNAVFPTHVGVNRRCSRYRTY